MTAKGQNSVRGHSQTAATWIIAALILSAALTASCRPDPSTPLIFAAASLSEVLAEVSDEYEQKTGQRVRFSFGGSRALAVQIANLGAPADAVIFAGQSPMTTLLEAGKVAQDRQTNVARNRLVVVSNGEQIHELSDLAAERAGLVAIADPLLAPAGEYAVSMLQYAGILDALSPRMVRTLDVRSALAAVSSGAASFAVVYRTDAIAADEVNVVLAAPEGSHPPITYPAAVIQGSASANEAARFIQYLTGDRAQAIFTRRAFEPPK